MLRKKIPTLEDRAKKIDTSEVKYVASFDNTLKQYVWLQEQETEFDTVELYEVRMMHPNHERIAIKPCRIPVAINMIAPNV